MQKQYKDKESIFRIILISGYKETEKTQSHTNSSGFDFVFLIQ